MKHYIFLTNQYLPKPGATGYCVHMVAKELAKRKHSVYVICYADGDNASVIDGVHVCKIPIPIYYQATGQGGRFQKFYLLFRKFLNIKNYPLRSKEIAATFCDKIESLIKEDTTVIASYTPLEAVYGMYLAKKKHPSIKTVYYSTDTLSNEKGNSGILPEWFRERKGLEWEKKIFAESNAVLIMECHRDHYYTGLFKEYLDRFYLSNFPLLNNSMYASNTNLSETNLIVYAGTLYKKLRNPEFACFLFNEIRGQIGFKLVFMGTGDCDDIIGCVKERMGDSFDYLGAQPHYVASEYLQKARYLLSIGNAESSMVPSKIYEYMATGKPIIHVYSYEYDPCIKPLREYGNALLVKEGDVAAANCLKDFLCSWQMLSYKDVVDKFPKNTPQFTADIIERVSLVSG